MFRFRRGGVAVLAFLLCSTTAFASSYTSTQSGNWNDPATWGGGGFPISGDTATITSNHVVTVTAAEVVLSVTLDSTAGNKMLVIDPTASLLVELAGGTAIAINAPSPGSTNIIRINGGVLNASNLGTNLSITGGATASKLEFTASGGTATFADNVVFAGTPANAIIDFGPSSGTLEIGGDLGSGGTFVNNAGSTVNLDGTGAQTINAYTFNHLGVYKTGGTATLNGPITVNGNLTVMQGVLDDGGNQISLNGGGTSNVTVGSSGVLKLGSAASATFFPTPLGTATMNLGSTVVYQAGVMQTINDAFAYDKLYLSTMGPSVNKILATGALDVNAQLDIWDNGLNTVTLDLGTGTLDLDGNLLGDGTVSMTSGSMTIAGNFSSSASLTAGTGTVTYDGSGAQSVHGGPYNNLTINKTPSVATLSGGMSAVNLTVTAGTFDLGSNTVMLTGNASVAGGTALNSSLATLQLNGSSLQTIATTPPLTFSTLTLTNAAGADFGITNITVNSALNLNGGVLAGIFFVDVLATVNRTSGWVKGELGMGMNPAPARRFHVGTPTSYIPVDVDAGSAGTLTIRANDGKSPDRTANNVLDAYWSITGGSVTPIDSITFNYNQSDVLTGDETQYILASYDGGSFTFTHYGDVDDVNNNVTATNLTGYVQDWIIGQPGSLAAASQLAIISVNSGVDPSASVPFDVVVESQDDAGTPTPVFGPTGVALSVAIGTGTLGGTTTGTINGGTDTVTISGVTYSPAENNVALDATRTSGDVLTSDTSATFDVTAAPSVLTVTNLLDSGAGSLRDAITTANASGCSTPCTIEFSVAGTITLASALPAITISDLTIDGYSAPTSLANSNAFGQPWNGAIAVALDGAGTVPIGLEVTSTATEIRGLALRNFTSYGVKITGTNTGSRVYGCLIGTDNSGTVAAPNALGGVWLSGSTGGCVGGPSPGDRNVISGHGGTANAIQIDGASSGNTVTGNYVGVKSDLSGALANYTGILIAAGTSNVAVGSSGTGNVVSGNTNIGIAVLGSNATIESNIVGPAGSSTTAIPNQTAIYVGPSASNNTIGGTVSPAQKNFISGNVNGLGIEGSDTIVDQNLIGKAPDEATPMGNTNAGIAFFGAAADNRIGTTFGNAIVNNLRGIDSDPGATGIGNTFRANRIYSNTQLAIDIARNGITANDATDSDTGFNNVQNFPVMNEAKYNAGNVDVKVTLNSSGGVNTNFFRFDVYKADTSPTPQAIEFLGSSGCSAGNVFTNFTFSVPAGTAVVGSNVVATATAYSDAACNTPSEGTSELSAATRIGGDVHWIAGNGNWETPGNWNPATVPASTDNAFIDNTGTYTVTINSLVSVGSVHVGAASGTQTLSVPASQSLNLGSGTASTVSSNGILTFNGIGLAASVGALNVSGTFNWHAGSITGAGGVTIATGGTLNIDTAAAKVLNAGSLTIANGATANWLNGAIGLTNAGSIDNFGLFESKVDSTITNLGSAGTFDNAGTFRKSTTAGTTNITNVTFNHTAGSVDLQTGTLNLSGGTASAPIAISSGATMLIDDNTYTLNAGANATGLGKIHINGGTLAVNGAAVTIEHLQLDLGTLGGTGTALSGANTWQWNGGSMSGGGTSVIEAGGSLVVGTASAKTLDNRTWTTQASSTTTVLGSGTINFLNGGTLNNAGLFNTAVDVTLADSGLDGGINNTGTFRKSGAAGSTTITNIDFANSGTIEVQTGTLNPGNVTNTGAIQLTGTLLVNDSTVTLNAGSNVSGTGLLQIAGGFLTVNTNDVLPNVQFDSGTLNGTATFDITSLLWNSGLMSGTGSTNIPNSATATFAAATAKGLQRTFSVAAGGTATVTGSGAINLSAGGTINNAGLFDFTVDGSIGDAGGDGGMINTGTFRKSGGTGTTSMPSVDLTNNSTIEIQTGTFNPASVTSAGPITLSGTSTFLVDDGIVTLNAGTDVSGTGLLHINNGTVTTNTADTIPNLKLTLGTLNGNANISVTNLLWEGGTMSGLGTTTIPAGATATIGTASGKSLQRTFAVQNGGTANVTGSGAIDMASGGNIQNDGTIEVTSIVTFNDAGAAGDIINTRTFRSNHAGTTTLTGITLNSTTASGQIDIPQGALDLADGTNSAAIAIGSGASFLVNSDTYTLAAGTTVGGTGTLSLTGGVLNVTGSVSVPQFAQTGGTLDGSGTLTLTNIANWSTGTMQGGGTTSVGSGATLNLITPSAKALNNRTLSSVAGGTINLTGVGVVNMSNGANVANAGTFLITADSNFNDGGTAGDFVNTGTLRKQSATGPTNFVGIGLTNNGGLVDIQSGTMNVTGSDTFTQTAGSSTLKIWLNGTTPGTGFGQITSNQNVNLAGTLEIALVGPYQPVGGNTFRVIAAPGHVGDFNQPYTYPVLAAGRTFSDAYDGSGLLLTVNGNADLSITKNAPSNVMVGAPISYTLTVSNAGPDVANTVSVTDTLPAGHTGISASGTGWSCNVVSLTVTCTVATLNTGAAPAITINATAPNTAQTFTNTANVTSANDSTAGNNSGSAIVTVDPNQAELQLSAVSPASPIGPSTAFSFTFNIKNNGPQTATGVNFSAPIPSTLTYTSATPSIGTCNFAANTVSCAFGNILNGVTENVVINLTSTTAAGTHVVTGSANAIETDPNMTNNSVNATIEVTGATITVTNTNDSGMGSLREALQDAANGVCTPLPCTINFNIPSGPFVIAPPTVELPLVQNQTIIDATTQPGYSGTPIVRIDGAGNLTYAFSINGNNNVVRGFSITGFNYGIDVHGNGNAIEANHLGLDLAGNAAPNDEGIRIVSDNNTVGGTTPAQRNVISGNTNSGVLVDTDVTGNTISGNYIGTDALGTSARPNAVGVSVVGDADNTTIGGATAAHANVISGNSDYGIYVEGSGGVIVGTQPRDASATAAETAAVRSTTGPLASSPAVVQASRLHTNAPSDGIVDNTVIRNNRIGTDATGTAPLGAGTAGISIVDDAQGTTIENNIIAYNGPSGVLLLGGQATTIAGNSIHSHTGLGIDIDGNGVTPNDANDSDTGANGLQNFPTLSSVFLTGGGNVSITSSINSSGSPAPVGSVKLEFFEADADEGRTFILSTCIAGNAFGVTTSFNAPSIAAGDPIVATATSYSDGACTTVADGTSEFSNVVLAANCTPPPVTVTGPAQMCAGAPAVTLDAGPGFAQYNWSTGATSQTITVAPGATTNYTVTVTDGFGCTNADSHTVTVNPLPTVTITGPTASCGTGSIVLDAGPGFATYAWNTGATSQTISVSPTSTTNYTVTVTDANTCSASDSHTVTVSANPTATIVAPTAVCENSTANNASVASQPGATYNWTIGNGTITSGQGTNAIVFTAGPSGTVTLGVTVTAGSCTSNGNTNVAITATPTVVITGPSTTCAGAPITLDAGAGFATYAWNNGATTRTITVTPTFDVTYAVTVTTGAGCSAGDTHAVTVTPSPDATITAPSSGSANQSGLNASVPAQPGAMYTWSVINGVITSGNGTDSIVFTAGASGTTQLDVTVTAGGCSATGTHMFFIDGAPPAPSADLAVTKSAPASVTPGATITYTIGARNFGLTAASNVVITDTLPSGTTFVAMNPGPWNCTRNGAVITCTGNAAAGANSTVTISVTAPQSGVITNTVSIRSSTHDPNGTNNSASATTSVQAESPTCTSAPPSLQLPVNLASVTSPATFTWSAVANASEYELWLGDSLLAVTTATSATRELPAGTFPWYVVARFTNGCDALASNTRTVTIIESNACANAAPEIRTPAPGTISSPSTFMWTPVAQAIGYRLWIEANGAAAEDVGTTTGATSLSVSLPPGPIVAYVDALFSGCRPTRSAPIAYTVARPDPCPSRTTANPISPANNATINSSAIEFTWSEAAGADGYRVWYSLDGAPPAVLGVTTTSDTSLRATIGRGTVTWFVETLHDGCASTESQTFRFTIPARNDCTQQKPTPLAPANDATTTNGNVLFAWSAVPNAVSYELWVAAGNGTPVLFGTTSNTTLTRIVPAGEIEWFVRAIVDRCGPRDSQTFRFTYTPPAACEAGDYPVLITPLAGATVNAPVRFAWTNAGAIKYELYVIRGNAAPQMVASTTATEVDAVNITPGRMRWFVRAYFNDCSPLDSEERELAVVPASLACSALAAPLIAAPGQISTGVPFLIQWTPVSGASVYQVLVADNANFDNAAISTVTATELPYQGANNTATALLRYVRVRAIDARCVPATVSPYGPAHVLVILPKSGNVASVPLGANSATFEIDLGPQYAGQAFTATAKQPWLTIAPASGVVAAGGTKLVVNANTEDLPVGTSVGSISVSFASSLGTGARITTHDTAIALPLSLGLVTPVMPSPTNTPPPDALIIPAVAHADGINSHFQSDVRVSNTSAQLMTYQLTFTPSGDSGITQGQQSTFTIEPGRTIALDDILKGWFGTSGNSAIGTLEIRPLTQTATSTQGTAFTGLANLTTFASSRTFNMTANGTFGQYIPAVPFANFVGSQRILSLQQIAQSSRYRTNLGIVEGSGNPASLIVRMFGEGGQQLGQFPLQLNGGQHMQLNSFMRDHGIDNLTDGRVEVEVLSADGKVTAYASVLDNQTSDPLLVTPVAIDGEGATKWVVPGVADLVSGFANWQTDMRLFNAGTTDVEATLLFYSQNGGEPKTRTITIPAGQVRQFDRALASLFDTSDDGGAVHITTANAARLIATARTYNQAGNGTYGQFISAVTPNEAAGIDSRPLQLLQVEETDRFRSNIGLVEVTGNPVRLEITAVPPDTKFTAVTELFLGANEFRQFGSILKSMGLADTHNARVTVRVLDGAGRVTAYASVIDMLTNDPTYVPAQ